MAVKTMVEDDFRANLEEILTPDLCWNIVGSAISENGTWADDYDFFDVDEFVAIWDKKFSEIIEGLRNGYDLDKNPPCAPGNPFADYFKWDGDTIDTTNGPAQYIYNDALFDIIDYIVDNLDENWYPEEVLEAIAEYKDYGGDL